MKVGLTLAQSNDFKNIIIKNDKEIKKLSDYIEGMTNYVKQAQEIGQQIHNIILPLIKPIQPMTFEKYVDLSTISAHNKKYLKNLFQKYLDYCKKYLNYNNFKIIDGCPLDLNLDIYNQGNALKFMEDKCNFKRTSIKKIEMFFYVQ